MTLVNVASDDAVAVTGLSHKVRLGNDPSGPVVFFVHGRAGNYDVMWTFQRTLPSDWTIIAPQAPNKDRIGGYSWWDVELIGDEFVKGGLDASQVVNSFIEKSLNYYNLTPKRLLGYGFSQGAGLLSVLLQKDPSRFSGIALLAGFVLRLQDVPPESCKARVFIAHGTLDEAVAIDRARKGVQHLRENGFDVTFVEDEVGHKVGSQGMKALSHWVSSFT
ncbi:MAG: hypothetical protein KDD53_10250 [Bdellovibrionales bacterium]|nr:hypothetical protein [Bdellovibrionales bacterium]